MKSAVPAIAAVLIMGVVHFALAQTAPPPVDPDAPSLTVQEQKDMADSQIDINAVQKEFQEKFNAAIKPYLDKQKTVRDQVEKEHPGYELQMTAQGWAIAKKPAPKPAAKK